ncbi:MAG: hypothetical protein GEU71_16545 [Actinobacteria bacterium]|nr:hypothetical protein [Actinomycetota bacterium]
MVRRLDRGSDRVGADLRRGGRVALSPRLLGRVEIFSAPDSEQVRSAWFTAFGSGLCLAAGPFGIWCIFRGSLWLALSGIALALPLVALAIYV